MFGDRPRVTPQEFHEKVRPWLSNEGFNDHQLDKLEALFEQSLQSNSAIPDWKPGIDQDTLTKTMAYMRAHPDATGFDEHQFSQIEAAVLKCI